MSVGLGVGVIAASGVLAACLAPLRSSAARDRLAHGVALGGLFAGSALVGPTAWRALRGVPWAASVEWTVPGAAFAFSLDRLSGFFVLTVLLSSCLAGLYGLGYLSVSRGRRALGPQHLFFNLLTVCMLLVVSAANGFAFLLAWELMTVFAYLLVSFEGERREVREAALTYLVMCHLGTIVLAAFFGLLGRAAGSLDFAAIAAAPSPSPEMAGALFALAVVGFGSKMGVFPLHSWLPLAHPAAPSHVSALMSGVIVKVAVYALLRGTILIGPPRPAFGLILVAIGAGSGVLGVVYALAQHDLKRLLAYHTIENIGIILLGLGLGIVGAAQGVPSLAVLGLAGGLLHVLNHALFKGLLFFGAGAVAQAAGTRDIERLGGLARRMPWTAATFLVASVAICGLPPLNGFVSEWLVYGASFEALRLRASPEAAVGTMGALALIGGLAAACFAKAFGVVFLGHARSAEAAGAVESPPSMRLAMVGAASGCLLIGLLPGAVAELLLPLAEEVARSLRADLGAGPAALPAQEALRAVGLAGALVIGLSLAMAALRGGLARTAASAPTWGCGYGAPTARMQYSAASFAAPLVGLARGVLRTRQEGAAPAGPFPGPASRGSHTEDWLHERLLRPGTRLVGAALRTLRPLQRGRLQLYLLYMFVALVVLLTWESMLS